jgi:hypothetical protein
VKPDADTVSTVPDDPPEGGPDRAFDPPPAAPPPAPGNPDAAEGGVAVAEGDDEVADAAHPAVRPMTPVASAAAAILRPRRCDSHPVARGLPGMVGSLSFMVTLLVSGNNTESDRRSFEAPVGRL